ncbi:GTP-binding protein [Helicobacter sp. NHP22-001]|uniref:CobW family GTP-binding protein n=1 Tax=Helicobacter sp. NHP22-001 TaxID=3040202 RepID=UPI00244D85A5|nr:GTP-binding protein [Helicobacter sp. NHP22-001]GMB96820.1 ATP-binding protein [Helicobacter sp. NHP22-001]
MAKIPVIILTGFLGSGKTTLLAQILECHRDKSIAVVVNERGQMGLDAQILTHLCFIQENVRLLQGGCVCCAYRQDLIDCLKELIDQDRISHVILETTGIANPAPILFSLLNDVFLSQHFFPQSVITCLDAVHGFLHLKENIEAQNQITASDVVVVTKTDLQNDFEKLRACIQSTNPTATIHDKARMDLSALLQQGTFVKKDIVFTSAHQNFRTLCMEFEELLDWSAFTLWLSFLLYKHGNAILRTKGILRTNSGQCIALNGVQHIIYPPTHLGKTQEKASQLVFILKDLDPQRIYFSFKTLLKALGIEFNPRMQLT